ncbi:MAG TPA: hypothetical protein VMS73_08240 [Anaerolineaceae bacterium]|nr:hypothetical protein [Anaerolineaceae bacterium]
MSNPQAANVDPSEVLSDQSNGQALIEAIRGILVGQERQHLEQIENELQTLGQRLEAKDELALKRLQELWADVQRLDAKTEPDSLAEELHTKITGLVQRTIQDSPDEMAKALGPVMGEAIRVRIRESRKDMVEAIAPIIGETIQKAISDFARELQRNIDAQLKSTFGLAGQLRRLGARLRGVSAAGLVIRDALPFSIEEIFLIHRETGLLLAHLHPSGGISADSDLVSGMLTAIREFVQDSFGHGQEEQELDEIQYGEQRIIIQGGRFAYLAVVTTGTEPSGFRFRMRELVAELHLKYGNTLRDFTGDPEKLPDLSSPLNNLTHLPEAGPSTTAKISRNQRLLIVGGLVAGLILLLSCCFYARFTYALLPVAFPRPTATMTLTATFTNTPMKTSTDTPTVTATPTQPPPTLTMTSTPLKIKAVALGDVWLLAGPSETADRLVVIPQGTSVFVLSAYGKSWLEVELVINGSAHQDGWVGAKWLFLVTPLPAEYITPAAIP